jgi:pimeloyl-ACP methyl ester carboxylesterase
MLLRTSRTIGVLIAVWAATICTSVVCAQSQHATVERFVPHVSSVPANKGEAVGLYLREKLSAATLQGIRSGETPDGRVVLFVHGNSVPSVPDFDLPYRDYSWMAYLADAGFDTFAMDQSGYGHSPRPMMANPCNLSEEDQGVLISSALEGTCAPEYSHTLTNSHSDWDEIDTVVDYIRELRNVDRVSLIGWSWGGIRTGGYAARHPEKVDKLILYAPGYERNGPSVAPDKLPSEGVPMTLQTHEALMSARWRDRVQCENQIDDSIQPVIWQEIMAYESYGSAWHPDGVMRVRRGDYWGWNNEYAARVSAPTLILIGDRDFLLPAVRELYPDLTGTERKVMAIMECATHFAVWEKTQYRFMHEASKEWLQSGVLRGTSQGIVEIEASLP